MNETNAPIAKYLQEQGLIKISTDSSRIRDTGKVYQVTELTDKGKSYLHSDYGPSVQRGPFGDVISRVQMCGIKLLRVTGIAAEGPGRATVEYEWTYDNPTPFATAYISTGTQPPGGTDCINCVTKLGVPFKGSERFQLYDDGWRIAK